MTTRMILSLKKAVGSRRPRLSLEAPSGLPMNTRDHHSPGQMNDIQLSAFNGEREPVRRSHLHEGLVLKLTNHSSGAGGERLNARG